MTFSGNLDKCFHFWDVLDSREPLIFHGSKAKEGKGALIIKQAATVSYVTLDYYCLYDI